SLISHHVSTQSRLNNGHLSIARFSTILTDAIAPCPSHPSEGSVKEKCEDDGTRMRSKQRANILRIASARTYPLPVCLSDTGVSGVYLREYGKGKVRLHCQH
ncbi:hypothetical protein, partial [Azospirillum agricola]|uniref:hypothetical protein n=1 Tax=Azospirillum agricola TaxID=1720247 RepID=UPI001AE67E12